ncbi:MAG: flagellar M-ring protein FliF [Betaproteobacteria bacterium]|nr:flagellar M-ring protein FliF [Betaproteobacteria bacterium]
MLFSNVSDRDGGAVIAALNQMNVPYRMSDGGTAILVPEKQVHDTRLKLASQGLPKGSIVGFELMENQKLGATQFQEQVNYQRALEGELARSIQALSAVSAARVHLAIPKPSVFLRDQHKPSASVIVNLHPGKTLDRAQVAGITHLVSSSVPELPLKSVSVIDQNGNLLSSQQNAAGGLDPTQLTYVQQIEAQTIKRIIDILEPIVGRNNVRAQVTAELDFSQTESSSESFKPNATPDNAVIRSEQKTESSENGGSGPQGVPGALCNQPPAGNAAPAGAAAAQGQAQGSSRRESTVNYEIDKTVRHVKAPVGAIKRLSAAVVVNHRKAAGGDAKAAAKALAPEEMTQINALVKEAMGYSQTRGDTLNVANAPFSAEEREVLPEVPLWQQPENIAMAKDLGKGLLAGALILYLLFGVIRPLVRNLSTPPQLETVDAPLALAEGEPQPESAPMSAADSANRLLAAKQLAKSDPKVVANVVKSWVSADE